MRIIRDATPNQYMVLVKFESQVCEIVFNIKIPNKN